MATTATVRHLREGLRSGHFPQALILAGPTGAGKYTLALMLAQTVNCLEPTESDGLPDFCGHCSNCVRIAESANLEERVAEAVASARRHARRGQARDAHPDPNASRCDDCAAGSASAFDQNGAGAGGDSRGVLSAAGEGHRAFTIFTTSAFMKEAANSLAEGSRRTAGAHLADSADREPARTAADDPFAGTSLPAGCAAGGGD